jgi:lysophospholipase L1-like esterase
MPGRLHISRWLLTIAAVVACAAIFGGAATVAGRVATSTSAPDRADPPTTTTTSRAALSPFQAPPTTATPATTANTTTTSTAPAVPLTPLGTKVAIVGDSLTEGLSTRLPPLAKRYGFDLALDAQNGRNIEGGLAPLKKIVSGRDLVVVALGTNDARADLTVTDAENRIEQMLALIDARTPVMWVNIYRNDTKSTSAAAARFDDALQLVADSHPNLTVLDWSAYIQLHPELMGGDHIHLTASGYDERAAWLAEAIAAELRLPPAPDNNAR